MLCAFVEGNSGFCLNMASACLMDSRVRELKASDEDGVAALAEAVGDTKQGLRENCVNFRQIQRGGKR